MLLSTTAKPHYGNKLYGGRRGGSGAEGKYFAHSCRLVTAPHHSDGISLAQCPPRMHKSGLLALADTYGLDRRELQQLKLLAEGFFDELRAQLASRAATSIRLNGLVQSISSFKDVCAGVPVCQLVFLGSDQGVAALIKADAVFARSLVDCVISGRTSQEAPGRGLTTVEEYLLSNTLATVCSRGATRTLAAQLTPGGELRRLEPALAESVSDSSEQLVLARITCRIGGGGGALELALPFSRISKPRAHPVPAHLPDSIPAESRARARLADARAELVAVLGQAMMPLEAVRALGPGSILSLRPFIGGAPNLELHCGDQVLFSGAVVEHRGWRRFLIQQTGVSDERTEQRHPGA
jgi:flagellar motor switch protein FliM